MLQRACVAPLHSSCPSRSLPTSWQRAQGLGKAPGQLQGWMNVCRAAGTATQVQSFPEQQAQLPGKVKVQFYSEKMLQILWHLKSSKRGGVCPSRGKPAWDSEWFPDHLQSDLGQGGALMLTQVGGQLPLCVTNAAQPG